MPISLKFPAAAVVALALAAPVAFGAGVTITTAPTRAKVGTKVKMTVKGMKANEKVKAVESAPFGQKRTLYPRAGQSGTLIVTVRAQIKGKHTWTFTGRTSHRSGKTAYYVK